MKSEKVEDQALDLNEFTLSRTSLDRKRVSIRSVLMEKSILWSKYRLGVLQMT